MDRLQYIDSLKGLAILLIVTGHVFLFCFQQEGIVSGFISIFHIALFFFLSGYLAFKAEHVNFSQQIVKKIKRIFIPFVSSILLLAAIRGGVSEMLASFDGYYWGMWFLIVLFEIFLIYYAGSFLLHVFKCKTKTAEWILWGSLAIMLYGITFAVKGDSLTGRILNLDRVSMYFPYFIFGYLVRRMRWEKILQRRIMISCSMTIWFIGFFILYNYPSPADIILYTLVRIGAISTLFGLFAQASDSSKIHRLSVAGAYSLDIYILHYYLLFSSPQIGAYLTSSGTFWAPENWMCGLILALLFAVSIVFLSIKIARFLRHNLLFSFLLFGQKVERPYWQ